MCDLTYYVWYAGLCGAASSEGVTLLEHFDGNPQRVFEADDEELLACEHLPKEFLRRFMNKSTEAAETLIETAYKAGMRILACGSDDYPERLLALSNFPIVLYARGRIETLSKRLCVGVVGTRAMSAYGKFAAFDIVRNLSAHNAVVVSGAAYGIDSVANNTAVYFGAETVAVLGSAVNIPYPRDNEKLLDRIAENGLVLSEYPPGVGPSAHHFPVRNRIISGLSDALLVVEADMKSGALITANLATDQGRAVYAVPGAIDAPGSRGTNALIRAGATLCTSANDILADFADRFDVNPLGEIVRGEEYIRYEMRSRSRTGLSTEPEKSRKIKAKPEPKQPPAPTEKPAEKPTPAEAPEPPAKSPSTEHEQILPRLDETQKQVLDAMPASDAVSPDKLVSEALSTAAVLSSLTMLELFGAVESLPGGLFRRLV